MNNYMTYKDVCTAVMNGHTVHWTNDGYKVTECKGMFYVLHHSGYCVGLYEPDYFPNGGSNEFYIKQEAL